MNSINAITNRLTSLFEGLNTDNDTIEENEIRAYAYAIAKIYDSLKRTLDNVFVSTADDATIDELCGEYGISLSQPVDERRESVEAAKQSVNQPYMRHYFYTNIYLIGDTLIRADNFEMSLSFTRSGWLDNMDRILRVVGRYLPAGIVVRGNSSGLRWSDWDNLNRTVAHLDKLTAPFTILQTI